MQSSTPVLELPIRMRAQASLETKFGGLPWGLPPEKWPVCEACSTPQSLIAQIAHDAIRIDLGKEGRSLLVFQCSSGEGCETWDGTSGANACVFLEPEESTASLSQLPDDLDPSFLEVEVRVCDWRKEVDDESKPMPGTKFGGTPSWVQSDEEPPGFGWKFFAQFASTYCFHSELPEPDAIGCRVGRRIAGEIVYSEPQVVAERGPQWVCESKEGGTWYTSGPNFGDGGTGYVFIRNLDSKPEGFFIWQCY